MADLTTFLPKFYAPETTVKWRFQFPWLMIVNDVSAAFAAEGRGTAFEYYQMSDISTEPADDTLSSGLGSDQTVEVLQITTETLELNQRKIKVAGFPEQARVQNLSRIMPEAVAELERAFNILQQAYVRSQFQADAGQVGTDVAITNAGIVGRTTATETVFLNQLLNGMEAAMKDAWPMDGRFCVVPVEFYTLAVHYLTDTKPNLGVGSLVDSAFVNGTVPKIYSFEILPDKDLKVAAGANKDLMHFGVGGVSIDFAEQWSSITARTHWANSNIYLNAQKIYGAQIPDSLKAKKVQFTVT